MAGKRTRGDESGLGGPVLTHQQLERRPGRDGADVEVGPADNRSGRGQADPAAHGLREPDPAVTDLRLGLDHRELDRRERDLLGPDLRPVADQAPAGLTVVDDLSAVDLDPGA